MMVTRISRSLLHAAAVVFVTACDDDGKLLHGCPTSYSTDWGGHGLRLEHTLPEQCPVFLPQSGTQLETGATVVDAGIAEFRESFLNVRDFSGDIVGTGFQRFRSDESAGWITPLYVSYGAGRDDLGPDKAVFQLTYLASGVPGPEATMRITYTDRVVTSISGPSLLPLGSSATFRANVTAGQAPFTYEWYRDWELVSTSASYTGSFHEDGQVYLRLDVTDARGEADSFSRFVTVSACSDGAKVC
ncbi:MAG TPA: hypothetical protein VEQ60_09235 [Longimicrobium sp.]|nr:hypothetical protein [Longimicrobium sp.]